MAKKIKKHISFDEDVLDAVKTAAKKERTTASGLVNKSMAEKLKVKI